MKSRKNNPKRKQKIDPATAPQLPTFISLTEQGTLLHLYLQPRASRTEVVGVHGERLKVAVASPPVDGKANKELLSFLSSELRTAKSRIEIVKGETSRQKDILVRTGDCKEIMKKLQY